MRVVVALVVLASLPARADEGVQAQLQIKVPDRTNPKTKGDAPSIEATILNGNNVPFDRVTLVDPKAQPPVAMKAIARREYAQGPDTIALALVVFGHEVWIGNDDWEADPNARYSGALKSLVTALDTLKLGESAPPGSQGVVITYSAGAEVRAPMGPLTALTGASLGSQKDYRKKVGSALVQGVTRGVSELASAKTVRKVLIVVGDGNDTDNDTARGALVELKRAAAKAGIETFAIIYKSEISDKQANIITSMISGAKTVNSIDGIATEMHAIVQRLSDRYYLTFPGFDPVSGTGFAWDGKEHELVVRIGQDEVTAPAITLAPVWRPAVPFRFPWAVLFIAGGVVFAIALVVVGKRVFARAPAPPPPPPVAEAPPPPEKKPERTVIMGAGGSEEGFPIVAWLVPLNGDMAYQTIKLRSGGTKIGTAPPANIVINDAFMSTAHCEIRSTPEGFTLVDTQSTNGSYVNDRKAEREDLFDNDVITLGKTMLKFKTVN